MIPEGALAVWREIADLALEPAFVALACAFVVYETAIRPSLARWS